MQKTLSGTPDEIMQQLADEIGKLSERLTESEDKATASDAALQVLLGVLSKDGKLDAPQWNNLLEGMAKGYDNPGTTLDEEATMRLKRVAGALRRFRVDPKGNGPKPEHPLLKVIDGGKEG